MTKKLQKIYEDGGYAAIERGLVKDQYPQKVIDDFRGRVIKLLKKGRRPSGLALLIQMTQGQRPKNHYNPQGVKFVT